MAGKSVVAFGYAAFGVVLLWVSSFESVAGLRVAFRAFCHNRTAALPFMPYSSIKEDSKKVWGTMDRVFFIF